MKKVMALVLAVVLLASMTVTAYAEENKTSITQDSNSNSANTQVTYTVTSGYTVTIPSKVELGNTADVSAEITLLPKGKNVQVLVSSGNYTNNTFNVKLKDNSEEALAYSITVDSTGLTNNAVVLNAASGTVTKNLSFAATGTAQYAGEYEDTLTFTISLVDSNS